MELQKYSFYGGLEKTNEINMFRYLVKKLSAGVMVLLGVVLLIFALFVLFPSADEIASGQRADAATKEAMRKEMGLDQSKSVQLLIYLKDLSPLVVSKSFNPEYNGFLLKAEDSYGVMLKWPYLRKSYQSKKMVSSILGDAFLGSLVLAFFAMGIALCLGIGLGIVSAVKPGGWVDRLNLAIATLGISLPSFFLAVIIAWLFGFVLKPYTGLSMTGSLYELNPATGQNQLALKHIILPAIALGVRPFSIILQLTRSSLIEVMRQDYIRTAMAKGLSKYEVIRKHALKNALNPVVTAASGWFASLLAGAFFIEYIFSWKGLGKVCIDALQQSDLPVVMGAVLLIAFIFIVVNVLVDLIYVFLDPRVKLS
jgi:peptide/nickel transport system permease protein